MRFRLLLPAKTFVDLPNIVFANTYSEKFLDFRLISYEIGVPWILFVKESGVFMFILLVYKDGEAYEYSYDTLEEAEKHRSRELGESELIGPQTKVG